MKQENKHIESKNSLKDLLTSFYENDRIIDTSFMKNKDVSDNFDTYLLVFQYHSDFNDLKLGGDYVKVTDQFGLNEWFECEAREYSEDSSFTVYLENEEAPKYEPIDTDRLATDRPISFTWLSDIFTRTTYLTIRVLK